MTDADLLRGARCGNAEAWRTLYQRFLPSVWRQAYALVADVHAAEDVTSETLIAFLQHIDRLDSDVPRVAGWLRSVVRCKAADYHRQAIRSRDKLPLIADNATSSDGDADPSGPLEAEETRHCILGVLNGLPDRQRLVLEWKYLDSMRVREIADRLGETERAVESVLHRARCEFRRLYELSLTGQSRAKVREHASVDALHES